MTKLMKEYMEIKKNELIPFGKYKDQPVEVLNADPKYREWLVNQGWFGEQYPQIHTLIVNNFQEPTDTPEHNQLQAKFLDHDWVKSWIFINPMVWQNISVNFEFYGWDVLVRTSTILKQYHDTIPDNFTEIRERCFELGRKSFLFGEDREEYNKLCKTVGKFTPVNRKIGIELKPTIGDDYPSILRNIKKLRYDVDVKMIGYYEFNSKGVTEEIFVKLMRTEGILCRRIEK